MNIGHSGNNCVAWDIMKNSGSKGIIGFNLSEIVHLYRF